jgi:ribonuclease BN (tRNA processing enzyme)
MSLSRRAWISAACRAAALGAGARLAPSFLTSERAFAQAGTGITGTSTPTAAEQTGMHLVLLGTQGGPNVNLHRAQGSNAIVVDGRIYIVDIGYGAIRNLVAAGFAFGQVGSVFLTHLHDDHTSDLPALLSLQWTGSKSQPTDVYGPHGTAALVDAAVAFARANADIRRVDEERPRGPEALFHGHDIQATAAPAQAFTDDRLVVRVAENTHFPEKARAAMPYRSLAYRFEARNRSIVISGDTAYSKNLVELARGADLFVCEAMDLSSLDSLMARMKAAAEAGNPTGVMRHVVDTHSTTTDVGRMAAEANVKTVVLTHLIPGSNRSITAEFPDTSYIDGVRQHFSGQVIVGRDLMVL